MENLIEEGVVDRFIVEQFIQHVLSLLYDAAPLTSQRSLYLGTCLGGGDEVEPLRLGVDRLRGEDLHLITTAQLLTEGYQRVIHLGPQAVVANAGVDDVGKIERRSSLRKCLDLTLGGEYEYFRREEVHLHGIEEIDRIGIGVGEYLLDGLKPFFQFIILFNAALLILPMCCKTFLGNVIHAAATNLDLNPFTIGTHHSEVQSLVTIGLWVTHPVTDTVRTQLVDIGNGRVNVPALLLLVHTGVHLKDDAHCKQVVHFVEADSLVLHLVPDRVDRLDAGTHLILNPHLVKHRDYRDGKILVNLVSFGGSLGNFSFQISIHLRMFIPETELFQFGFNGKKTQSVCQRSIDVKCFTGNFELLRGTHRRESTHVMQPVSNLDQNHTDVVRHSEQQLAEVFSLCRYILTKHAL